MDKRSGLSGHEVVKGWGGDGVGSRTDRFCVDITLLDLDFGAGYMNLYLE